MKKNLLGLVVFAFTFFSLNSESARKSCAGELGDAQFQGSGSIPTDWVAKMRDSEKSPLQQRMNDAAQSVGLQKVALNRELIKNHNTQYSNEVSLGCTTDQKMSGRCWIFGGNNMLRAGLIDAKVVDKNFSLSHTYLHFFNMLEKSNRWLWRVEQAQLQNLNRRDELRFIESDPFGDGGHFAWYQFLVKKYGMVPQQAMPDSESSLNTFRLNENLKTILSDAGVKVKALAREWGVLASGQYSAKQMDVLLRLRQETMSKIYLILETNLGVPPSTFEFTNAKTKRVQKYTPETFRDKFIKYKPDDYVVIANNARQPRGQYYEFTDSTIGVPLEGGQNYPVRLLNLSFDRMDELIRASIDANRPMWFATDVGKQLDAFPQDLSKPGTGIWHPDMYRYSDVYNMDRSNFQLDVNTLTEFRLSVPTHAMVIVAYDRSSNGKFTIKYKVENSWGDKWGDRGYGHMYREWAELFLAQIVVHKSMLSKQELKLIQDGPVVIAEDDFY